MESFSVAPDGPPVCREEQIPAPTPLGRPKKPKSMEYEPILYHLDTAATFYKLDMVGSAAGGDAMAGDGTATLPVAGGGDSPVVIHRKIIKIKRQVCSFEILMQKRKEPQLDSRNLSKSAK